MILYIMLLSLFEYVGNLIGFFWKGEHGQSLKWKGVSGASLDKENPFSKKDVSKIVAKAHRELVTHLEEYRAKIFHYKFHETNIFDGGAKEGSFDGRIEVNMSTRFKKIFKNMDVSCQSNESEILVYSESVVLKSFEVVEEIFIELLKWKIDPMPNKLK